MSEATFKGIPLPMWKNMRLVATLSESELLELHAILYCAVLDEVEPSVLKSDFIESTLLLQHIKDNL